ncbi:phosphate ABC transporter permease subunit PstC [Gloeothece verrucosa]|uniref:Phosphate transport system permease protein n=1 Tax=Gloeothece verrucosa (strain PCC 7822) TaxID=497965 RepID=E0UFA7_GLOV7|nr:phosphate ABC transporter permease subunit PstC [Gloeothece verrucosa]ADN15478.1 phosphate ABC transporter, inner membrane subunit PstC [Gloeothece verrucosa PCC 7822]
MTNFSDPIQSDPQTPDLQVNITSQQTVAEWLDKLFSGLVWLCAFSGVVILLWIAWIVFNDAEPALKDMGLKFLWSVDWNVGEQKFGGLPYIYGTIVSSFLALLIAVPLSLAVAITTSENFLPLWVRSPVGFMVELIASIPSVIVGLWGIFVLIPLSKPLQEWLHSALGWIPLFNTPPYGPSMLIAGVVLAIMILPTIAAISRDVLLAVPPELRSASMALGATRWETIWRTILPTASSGIIGGVILGLGRALGETMAVTMVIGNSNIISASLLDPGYTIPAVLANQFAEAFEPLHIGALMYLALILFVITLFVNSIAVLLVQFIQRNI